MAILGIRTGWGPQATEDRRKYKLDTLKAEERLKLEKEKTKQVTKGDADVAAALMGLGVSAPPEPEPFLGIDWQDQNTQIAAGVVALGGALLAKRRGWF